jgi:hypothetical protein
MIKNLILIFTIFILSFSLIFFAYLLKSEDICCRYEICQRVTNICESEEERGDGYTVLESEKGEKVYIEEVESLTVGDTIRGKVMGTWFFEGEFPVRVLDEDMELIDSLSANADYWFTSDYIPFELTLDFDLVESTDLILRFEKSNPSDMIENSDYVDWRVKINAVSESIVVKAYFPNVNMGSTEDCSLVYPVEREVVKSIAVGRKSLEELLKGVTDIEEQEGYFTNIGEGVDILSLTISNGIARVDFSSELGEGVGGSCKVESIRAQIEETLKQFDTVDEVVISIEGNSEDILQP